jgi:hypothetical protein
VAAITSSAVISAAPSGVKPMFQLPNARMRVDVGVDVHLPEFLPTDETWK